MRKYTCNGVDINIWTCNGVYYFPAESAEGKTFLYSLLSDISRTDKSICTFTYTDYEKGFDIARVLSEDKYEVIFLDRFDLYQTREIVEVVSRLSYTRTIFIDVKGDLLKYDGVLCGCFIDLYDSRIEVTPF